MSDSEELIQVYVGEFTRAGHVMSLLEAEGVQAFLQDEHMSTIHPIVGFAKVLVAKSDLQRATAIVQGFREKGEEDRASLASSSKAPLRNEVNWLLAIGGVVMVFALAMALSRRAPRTRPRAPAVPSFDEVIAFSDQGKYVEATEEVQRVLKATEQIVGPDDLILETPLFWLADLLQLQGRYSEAVPVYQRLLELGVRRSGPENAGLVDSLFRLAGTYTALGRYEEALPLYERIIQIRSHATTSDHVDVIKAHEWMGDLYIGLGRYSEAKTHWQLALAMHGSALPPEHPTVKGAIERLAYVQELLGDYAASEALYERLVAVTEKAFGPEHPAVAATLMDFAVLLRKSGKVEQAVTLEARAQRIYSHQNRSTGEQANGLTD